MIIKLSKIISCSSEHPSYPASNLLHHGSNASWRTAKPGEMLATVVFQLVEPSCITGLDIGNYRSCVIIVTASTSAEPDNWIPIINHQFMTNDEATNGNFKDQVRIFTKKDLNPDNIKIKFDRAKVTCMQSANLKELFGLSFITLKTEVTVDLGLDVFGRFKLKKPEGSGKSPVNEFKEKYLKMLGDKKTDYKRELMTKIKETGMNNFSQKQAEDRVPMKRPLLEKLEAGKAEEVFGTKNKNSEKSPAVESPKIKEEKVMRTPFGDIISSSSSTSKTDESDEKKENRRHSINSKKRSLSPREKSPRESKKRQNCVKCQNESNEKVCKDCNKPIEFGTTPKKVEKKKPSPKKPKKPFEKLFEDVTFSLSGYVNPQRDEIRRKALKMGARYIADPNTTNKKCTHLVCAFKNTPKYQQFKGHSKIISHTFIEQCFNKKTRFPWRRFALDSKDKAEPESEEEISGSSSPPNPFLEDTDESDSDSNY